MYLYVEFADTHSAWIEAQMGFGTVNSHRRIKKIKLTDEQVKELQPQKTGKNGDKPTYEAVSVLCIQGD